MQTRKFFIAGVKFHDLSKVINQLSEGDYLDLVPDPDNKFDSNAVRIEHEGTMLGFVPKTFSAEIAAAIEALGVDELECEITKLDPYAKTYEQCEVQITSLSSTEDEEDSEEEF
jgi:hypothetical protein